MKAIDRKFSQFINGNHQFVIPIFQRDYSWTTEECEQLWNDIIRTTQHQNDAGHFIGSIVYVGTGAAFNTLLVIDGQQRLTTLTLLLTALRDHIDDIKWVGTDGSPTAPMIDAFFLKNVYESGDRIYKLVLRRVDDATLKALVDGKEVDEAEASELVLDAYDWFRDALMDIDPDSVYQGISRLSIVDVTLDRNTDDPQLIFESLNSTGVDLSQSDLVRNYLLMGLDEPEQTRLYQTYWSKIEVLFHKAHRSLDYFLRDYVALKTRATTQIRSDRVYDVFKEFKSGATVDYSLEALLADMERFAGYYLSLLSIPTTQYRLLSDAQRNLRLLGTTHAVLGMQLYDYHSRAPSLLLPEKFAEALRLIESFIVRRAVMDWQSRDYWSVFASAARDIDRDVNANGTDPLEALKVALARQRYHFPADEQFSREVQDVNLYWRRDLCSHILARLENDGQREPSPVGEYSIEHIMPQSIEEVPDWQQMLGGDWEETHAAWVHRLGNLTLTGYNSTLSNRPFEEKKTIEGGFNQSAARLNSYVRDQRSWTETEMRARGENLARRSLAIWPHHKANESLLRDATIRDLRTRAARRTSGSLSMRPEVRDLLEMALSRIRELGDVIEIVEHRSVSCYGPEFFVELLPMKNYLRLILPLDFDEVEVPDILYAADTTTWKFVPNRVHTDCGMLIDVTDEEDILAALPLVRRAFDAANG